MVISRDVEPGEMNVMSEGYLGYYVISARSRLDNQASPQFLAVCAPYCTETAIAGQGLLPSILHIIDPRTIPLSIKLLRPGHQNRLGDGVTEAREIMKVWWREGVLLS